SSFLRFFVFSYVSLHPPSLPFSPTRRSSDLGGRVPPRLNIFEFAGMLGILGGLGVVAFVPTAWGWKLALAIVSAPVVISLLLLPRLERAFPHALSPVRPAAPLGEGMPGRPDHPTAAPPLFRLRTAF